MNRIESAARVFSIRKDRGSNVSEVR